MANSTWSRAAGVAAVCGAVFFGLQAALGGGTWLTPPAPITAAVVDVPLVAQALNEMKDLKAAQATRFDGYKKQLDQAETEAKAAKADMDEAVSRGAPDRNAKRTKAVEAEAIVQARGRTLQRVVELETGSTQSMIYAKILAAVQTVATEQGLDLVLLDDRSIQPREESSASEVLSAITARKVLFANKRLDITQDVITRMNNDYSAVKTLRN